MVVGVIDDLGFPSEPLKSYVVGVLSVGFCVDACRLCFCGVLGAI